MLSSPDFTVYRCYKFAMMWEVEVLFLKKILVIHINHYELFLKIMALSSVANSLEPRHEKTNILHMGKQRRRSASR